MSGWHTGKKMLQSAGSVFTAREKGNKSDKDSVK
jgi:hypothetical protein